MRLVGALVLFAQIAWAAPSGAAEAHDRWSGFYGGVQFGALTGLRDDASSGRARDGAAVGLHAGYAHDLGDWVIGAEVDVDGVSLPATASSAAPRETVALARFKLRAGYDLGPALLYATGGPVRSDTTTSDETGAVYGMGVSYEISNRFLVSGEVLNHDFARSGDASERALDADSISMRFSLRF